MTPERTTSDGPLVGVRVLDLSAVFAAPYMGALLSDLGAEVIKIEPPARLDQTRGGGFGPYLDNDPGTDGWNWSGTFHSLNRGKKSLVLDLKQEDGRAILRDLVANADILLENFTPRVMRGWSMSYPDLAQLNPRLIMLSNTGYGSTGPWSAFKAQGTTLEATMGLTFYTGYDGAEPRKTGQSYPDFIAAWTGLTAIMSAVLAQWRTGRGRWIDLGMYELGGTLLPEALIAAQAGAPITARTGNRELGTRLSGVYPCREREDWLAIGIADDAMLAAAGNLIDGLPPRIAGTEDAERADAAVAAWARSTSADEAAEQLQAAGVAAAAVADVPRLLRDPQYIERGFFEWTQFRGQSRPVIGRPYNWHGRHTVRIRGRGPLFGEHSDALLTELGVSPQRIAELREKAVVVDVPLGVSMRPANLDALIAGGVFRGLDTEYRETIEEAARQSLVAERATEAQGGPR
ncbi:CaiB/BaiF CoA-transferase family protein [Blastococcus sp. URHD0036]|uniref:CaiB/BaiF CoA transferase family protein n=1 Tax=Blastococcus sp. URHD0036 TaxID=1380356 RepID=UPI0004950046|nr:CoA transferase [Blastococcus sp. URHD0036]